MKSKQLLNIACIIAIVFLFVLIFSKVFTEKYQNDKSVVKPFQVDSLCQNLRIYAMKALEDVLAKGGNKIQARRAAYYSMALFSLRMTMADKDIPKYKEGLDALFKRVDRALENPNMEWKEDPKKADKDYEKIVRVLNKAANDTRGYDPDLRHSMLMNQFIHQVKHFRIRKEDAKSKAKEIKDKSDKCIGQVISAIEDRLKRV